MSKDTHEAQILAAVQKKIRTEMNDLADELATGGAVSYDEYRQMVGRIQGFALVERHILDLVKSQEPDDL